MAPSNEQLERLIRATERIADALDALADRHVGIEQREALKRSRTAHERKTP